MNDTLTTYRNEIDKIDRQLIDLLKQRIGIVGKVGEYKKETSPHYFPIRPAREAKMLRAIAESFKDSTFNADSACQIWRLIIGASTHAEADLTISVYVAEDKKDYLWLAREYFGPCSTIITHPHVKRVISDVVEGNAAVGVIPIFSGNDDTHDWTHLIQPSENAPKIFAHLPFVNNQEGAKMLPTALAFSKLEPEDSGDDVSFFALQTQDDTSQNRIQKAFTDAGMVAKYLAISNGQSGYRQHLIEVQGFLTATAPNIDTLRNTLGESLQNLSYLGSYATPLILSSDTHAGHDK